MDLVKLTSGGVIEEFGRRRGGAFGSGATLECAVGDVNGISTVVEFEEEELPAIRRVGAFGRGARSCTITGTGGLGGGAEVPLLAATLPVLRLR